MGWLGSIVGSLCGCHFGGLLGSIAGSVLGSVIQDGIVGAYRNLERGGDDPRNQSDRKELIFLTAVGAMLAKLAKADGHVDVSEIEAGERAFVRLGLTAEKRAFCINAFRQAKMDGHSIYEYANAFASVVRSNAVRELFYDILWDMACADGVVSPEEMEILRNIPLNLRIRATLFQSQRAWRLGGARTRKRDTLHEAYELLGCRPDATDADVRRAYREKAKKLHPDLLRAQGLPEELLRKANEQMARINGAWDEIRRARGMK